MIEKVMEETSFASKSETEVEITTEYIRECVKPMLAKADISRYII